MFQWDEVSQKNLLRFNEKKYFIWDKIFGCQGVFRLNLLHLKTKCKQIYLTEWFKEKFKENEFFCFSTAFLKLQKYNFYKFKFLK